MNDSFLYVSFFDCLFSYDVDNSIEGIMKVCFLVTSFLVNILFVIFHFFIYFILLMIKINITIDYDISIISVYIDSYLKREMEKIQDNEIGIAVISYLKVI